MTWSAFCEKKRYTNKLAGGFLSFVALATLAVVALSWQYEVRGIVQWGESHESLATEKREAYSWIRLNTPPSARLLAEEDASLYLYTDRQSLRGNIFSPAGLHSPDVLNRELPCIISNAEPIGARYWVVAEDDFNIGLVQIGSYAKQKATELESTLPLVFRSSGGHVRIHALRPVGTPVI